MASRRKVRVAPRFFDVLDLLLPSERGEDGTPSRNDFEAYDLIGILDRFAERWDDLPALFDDREDYRALIGAGRLVATYTVTGQSTPDGWIDLLDIEIQLRF